MSLLDIANQALAEIEAAKPAKRGITVADVLRVFPGARVISATLPCIHCGGTMVDRVKGRRHVLNCSRCGRSKR